jgi:hypothetical protein
MDDIQDTSVASDWAEIEALFPVGWAMRPNKAWTNGISTRAGHGRLSRMLNNPGAGPLAAKLDQMNDAKIKALRTYAAVNLEQAAYGFRATAVANITIPALVLTISSQLASGSLGKFIFGVYDSRAAWVGFLSTTAFVIIMIVLLMSYALAAFNQARDIRHIIDLRAAERGIYFGLEDIDDLHAN